ncbi:MAG: hypothetical protein IH626_24470 [Rhodospirillales bacterium]|nr:hypothetical protein [Rhodospirillales bacterium]
MTGFLDNTPVRLRFAAVLAVAALLAGWPGHADGRSRSNATTVAGGQCVQVANRVGGDILVNTCDECRIAYIEHQRRGQGLPLNRSYRISAKSKMELSFVGSGKTRVTSDGPCDPNKPAAIEDVKDCAKLATGKNGQPALLNACPVCRGVVIERVGSNGRRDRETFALSPRTMLPVAQRGAAQIKIVSEMACP